jgi:hypothetical protein
MDSAQPDAQQPSAAVETPSTTPPTRRVVTNDDFLVPGPTPESNEGLGRWGLSWLLFSVVLMLLMLGMSALCWLLATATGIA